MKRNARKIYGLLAMLALAIVAGVIWLFMGRSVFSTGPANVILISIDTCRADHLSCYGYRRETTPHIDALASEGFLFQNVIAPVPLTLPSHCSMMTGTNPPFHGVHDNIAYRLGESNVTLAEILKENGYTTGAVVGAFMMDPKFGLGQGFDTYDANIEPDRTSAEFLNERRAQAVNRVASAWLENNADRRFFLFLHYFDPHFPYEPPEPFATTFLQDKYAGEIAYVDRCIGEIISQLKRLGLYDSTMIVVTSDHGESLQEHGEDTHGWFIYHSTTKVPLVVKLPAASRSGVINDKVALVDLAPTVLEMLGIAIPEDVQGRSLLPHFRGRGRREPERYIYSESLLPTRFECSSVLGMETAQWKYIQTSQPELYDLLQDPGETKNLVNEHADIARSLRERLKTLLDERTRIHEDEARMALDRESVSRLEGLGYVGGGGHGGFEFETGKEDPKDFLLHYQKIIRAMDLTRRHVDAPVRARTADGGWETVSRYTLAKRICREVLGERPDVIKAHAILGRIAFEEGDLDVSGTHYSEILRIDPASAEAHNDLGHVRLAQGRQDEAASLYREAVRLVTQVDETDPNVDRALVRMGRVDPVLRIARLSLADVLHQQGKTAEAAAEYREALAIDPNDAKAHYVIGLDLAAQGKQQEAIEEYKKALAVDSRFGPARRALAAALKAILEEESP